jgi:hypothetical protein
MQASAAAQPRPAARGKAAAQAPRLYGAGAQNPAPRVPLVRLRRGLGLRVAPRKSAHPRRSPEGCPSVAEYVAALVLADAQARRRR